MKGDSVVKQIQIKNFRSLKDTGMQTLSPITILVGQNSSGKSTFLRAFPLLKQSISKRTSGPILWAGDVDDYVDFGSFQETVTNDGSNEISFRFKFDLSELGNEYDVSGIDHIFENGTEDGMLTNVVEYEITLKSFRGKDVVTKLSLSINDTNVVFVLRERTIRTNRGFVFKEHTKKQDNSPDTNSRTPFGRSSTVSRTFGYQLPDIGALLEKYLGKQITQDSDGFKFYCHTLVNASIGKRLVNKLPLATIDEKYITKFPPEIIEAFNHMVELLQKQDDSNLEEFFKICYFYSCFPYIDEYLFCYFRQVHYIAPVRATAERYYRLRNLAVDEVDFQGKNLAIFINSLPLKRLSDFQAWTNEHFGFSVIGKKIGGHLSLRIKLRGSEQEINLSDTGFGYSQILPIITQLWELSTQGNSRPHGFISLTENLPLVIAIEQPELHLHPAIQAKLAKAFIACIDLARKNGRELQLLLETHSETIVNYFGRAIARRQLKTDDISVIIFEKKAGNCVTEVQTSHYNKYGMLTNWPYGFFESED